MACKIMSACMGSSHPAESSIVPFDRSRPRIAEATPRQCVADELWAVMREEAASDVNEEPLLRKHYFDLVLSHCSLEAALASYIASKLAVPSLIPCSVLQELFSGAFVRNPDIGRAIRADLLAARDRDPACSKMVHCFLYYKGFLALQAHRVAHWLWGEGRVASALMLQSRVSEAFAVDIHPGARIGSGVLLDHATGVVIGETAVVGDDVTILHGVTLGGTGKEAGDRHPKLGDGVLVGAGTKILGNVTVDEGAKIGAGSVVLKAVPRGTTAVGNPARLVRGKDDSLVRQERKPGRTTSRGPTASTEGSMHTSISECCLIVKKLQN